MGYQLNRLDEPVLMAVSKPLPTEFGIHHRLESCEMTLLEILLTCVRLIAILGKESFDDSGHPIDDVSNLRDG